MNKNMKQTEGKHTPGPWIQYDATEVLALPGGNEEFRVAEVDGPSIEETRANARLIAAAPDQYSVLTRIAAMLDDAKDLGATSIVIKPGDPLDRAIRAAIEKAEGRP